MGGRPSQCSGGSCSPEQVYYSLLLQVLELSILDLLSSQPILAGDFALVVHESSCVLIPAVGSRGFGMYYSVSFLSAF